MELKYTTQNYDWGMKGMTSCVARLLKGSSPDAEVEDEKTYSELWMGTHQNGPSFIKETGKSLREFVAENKEVLGEAVRKSFGDDLPFLFKVLSVRKALSLQAHPDKERAEALHKLYPEIYKDPNHKPEMPIALTPFEALCGFRPFSEIQNFLKTIPELSTVIGEETTKNLIESDEANSKAHLQKCLNGLLTHPPDSTAEKLKSFLDRLSQMDESGRDALNARVIEKLYGDFPGDVGCFGLYFFNYVILQPGEALYLGANEPHAYISGDCMEIMSCSDNVVRAGLTPKLKDVPTLIEMLTYNCEPAESKKYKAIKEDDFTEVFRPPIKDFAVAKIELPPGTPSYQLPPRTSAGILIIIEGSVELNSQVYASGSVLFIKANDQLNLNILTKGGSTLMFEGFANV
ncbi:mannose-6-phosphate isomerase [Fopius arisanus]|uniref:mannose-6-phosphate isomerase n=1 Tax=Fopius arisanus TaxID=64838 RepID=A0A9R1T764_9HYME|nr:PREDICTED: mannose-6-phosphate isomerase-like [Fopius arisanus]